MRATHIRDKEFVPFAFEINSEALPVIVPDYKPQKTALKSLAPLSKLSADHHREALSIGIGDKDINRYTELIECLQTGYDAVGYPCGRNKIVQHCKYLTKIRAILKTEEGYKYNPDFTLDSEEEKQV